MGPVVNHYSSQMLEKEPTMPNPGMLATLKRSKRNDRSSGTPIRNRCRWMDQLKLTTADAMFSGLVELHHCINIRFEKHSFGGNNQLVVMS